MSRITNIHNGSIPSLTAVWNPQVSRYEVWTCSHDKAICVLRLLGVTPEEADERYHTLDGPSSSPPPTAAPAPPPVSSSPIPLAEPPPVPTKKLHAPPAARPPEARAEPSPRPPEARSPEPRPDDIPPQRAAPLPPTGAKPKDPPPIGRAKATPPPAGRAGGAGPPPSQQDGFKKAPPPFLSQVQGARSDGEGPGGRGRPPGGPGGPPGGPGKKAPVAGRGKEPGPAEEGGSAEALPPKGRGIARSPSAEAIPSFGSANRAPLTHAQSVPVDLSGILRRTPDEESGKGGSRPPSADQSEQPPVQTSENQSAPAKGRELPAKVKCLFDYAQRNESELTFKKGDTLVATKLDPAGNWAYCRGLETERFGWCPIGFLEFP